VSYRDQTKLPLPPPEPREPTAPLVPAGKDKRAPAVGKKVKAAIAALLSMDRPELQEAAKAAGLTTYLFREALKKPHVLRYLDAERNALVDAACAGNPAALKLIRDKGENAMAAVSAAKALEQMRLQGREIVRGGAAGGVTRPGIIIVIREPAAQAGPERPIIDINPQSDPDPVEDAGWGLGQEPAPAVDGA
jgi:hypothetical protein